MRIPFSSNRDIRPLSYRRRDIGSGEKLYPRVEAQKLSLQKRGTGRRDIFRSRRWKISSSPLRDVVNSFNRYLTRDPWIGLKEPAFRTITCNLGNNGKRRVWVLYLELNINFWGILFFAILFFLLRLSLAPFPLAARHIMLHHFYISSSTKRGN